jgi:hypothetical protein
MNERGPCVKAIYKRSQVQSSPFKVVVKKTHIFIILLAIGDNFIYINQVSNW